jgi:hypothetical protein
MDEEKKDTKAPDVASEDTEAVSAEDVKVGEGKPKKSHKKAIIILVVIAIILVAGGIGFEIWHSQPTFCNAVCHTPMDYYVNGYESSDTTAHLSAAHREAGVTCLQCHTATINDQVTEGMAWISGSYSVDSSGALTDTLVTANSSFCLRDGCHDWNTIVAATDGVLTNGNSTANPHSNHQISSASSAKCSNCHSVHGTSTLWCNSCHSWSVPDGWTS